MTRALPAGLRRIEFLAPRIPEMSGGSTAIENLANVFQAEGVEVGFISIWPGTRSTRIPVRTVFVHERLHRAAGRRHRSRTGRLRNLPLSPLRRADRWHALRGLRQHVESVGPDTALVITHVMAAAILDESGWKPQANGPLLIGQHHSQFESLNEEPHLAGQMSQHFQSLDAFTALTAPDAQKFESLIPAPCFGIGNPISKATLRSRHDRHEAIALARFSGEKQLDLMVRLFAEATRDGLSSDWTLSIYGSGPEEERVRTAIRASGAGNRIRLRGRTDDARAVLADASVNLLTSRYEGFGMTILEAATVGVPTVAFDCSPGVHDLVADGGILVAPGDEDGYVRSLRDLLSQPERIKALGAAALDAADRFSPEATVAKWGTVLEYCKRHRAEADADA